MFIAFTSCQLSLGTLLWLQGEKFTENLGMQMVYENAIMGLLFMLVVERRNIEHFKAIDKVNNFYRVFK